MRFAGLFKQDNVLTISEFFETDGPTWVDKKQEERLRVTIAVV